MVTGFIRPSIPQRFIHRCPSLLRTGSYNVAVGHGALAAATSTNGNTAIGEEALHALNGDALKTSTVGNVALGENSAEHLQTGKDNGALGPYALDSLVSGNNNLAIGSSAGFNITSGSNQFFVNTTQEDNSGEDIADSLMYGNFSGTDASTVGQFLDVNGKLGVASTSPFAALSVSSSAALASTAYLFDVASTTNLDLFHIAANGEVVGTDLQTLATGQISPMHYLAFTLGTSTTWTGTSTNSSVYGDTAPIVMPFTGTIKNMNCFTSAGTLNVEASSTTGVNAIYQAASSTPALLNFSLAITKNVPVYFTAGTPASSPTFVSCTLGAVQTP